MEDGTKVAITGLCLAVSGIVLVVFMSLRTDIKMAELGYVQTTAMGTSQLVWVKGENK